MTTSLRNMAALAFAALVVAAVVACTVSTTGAPCDSIDNCPKGQFCSVEGKCFKNQKDAPCETDAHCPAGEYCAEGTCAEGEASGEDAGADAGGTADAGLDAGSPDAGQVNCAIDANCMSEHVTQGVCVNGRCQLTCEKGWVDRNADPADGCEHESECVASGGWPNGEPCSMTAECACGATTSHCVKGLVEYMGFGSDGGVCLEDCSKTMACRDAKAKCIPTKLDENGQPTRENCFKTGKLTGSFTVLVKDACKDAPGDARAGLCKITLPPYYPDFTVFSACKDQSSEPKLITMQGFKFCPDPQSGTPCPDVLYIYVRQDAATAADIPYFNVEKGWPNFGVMYLWADFDIQSNVINKMALRGTASGGRISNFVKTGTTPLGAEYKGDVDIDLIEYDVTVCGGSTGKECPKLGQ